MTRPNGVPLSLEPERTITAAIANYKNRPSNRISKLPHGTKPTLKSRLFLSIITLFANGAIMLFANGGNAL
jgi:hypothetical protein